MEEYKEGSVAALLHTLELEKRPLHRLDCLACLTLREPSCEISPVAGGWDEGGWVGTVPAAPVLCQV